MKKENKNSKLKNIKEFLADKRNKALVKLIFWFIFFVIVIIYVRFINSQKQYVDNNEPLNKTITEAIITLKNNYEFTFEYETSEKYTITGKKHDNKWLFNYNDSLYYYDNELYNIVNDEKILVKDERIKYLLMFDTSKIYNYLKEATYDYKKESVNGLTSIGSNIPLNKFGELINEQIDSNDTITFETVEENNILKSINIDLTNYYKITNSEILSFKLNIIYDFKEIEDFNY